MSIGLKRKSDEQPIKSPIDQELSALKIGDNKQTPRQRVETSSSSGNESITDVIFTIKKRQNDKNS